MDLVKQLQERMGYPALQKVDPNTQDIAPTEEPVNRMGQAVIPTALTALDEWSTDNRGARMLLRENYYPDWGILLFGSNYSKVVQQIAQYANASTVEAETKLKAAFTEAVSMIREEKTEMQNEEQLQSFLSSQKQPVLSYLPGSLHIGKYLNHETLDDQVKKMEGPVSSIMHKVGQVFDQSEQKTEEDKEKNF